MPVRVNISFGKAGDIKTSNWLRDTMNDLVLEVERRSHKKTLSISYSLTGRYSAAITIKDPDPRGPFTMADWAYGVVAHPPPGGYRYGDGGGRKHTGNIPLHKPWGTVEFRTRTYVGKGGRKVPGSGFLAEALKVTFNRERLHYLGRSLAEVIKDEIVYKAVRRQRGVH